MSDSQSIIVLEDDPDAIRLYEKALGNSGYAVCPVSSIAEADALLADRIFDLCICDMRLGGEHGSDFLTERFDDLHAQGTKVIVVSGNPEYRPFCEELGVEFYLEKPVSLSHLVILVSRLLRVP
jgi:DNA-binding NtrC family response regulator